MMTDAEIESLREEIKDLQAYVDGLPEELCLGHYGESYKARLEMLREELSEKELVEAALASNAPMLDLRLFGAIAPRNRVPASFYGMFVQNVQWLFSSLGQAATGRATTRGAIPKEIIEQTQLEIIATPPGSFITRLAAAPSKKTQLHLIGEEPEPLSVAAFRALEEVLDAGANEEALRVAMHRLKGRVLSAYASLLELLQKSDADLDIGFVDPRKPELRRRSVRSDFSSTVLPMLSRIASIEENEITLVGVLNAANRRTGSFEIDLGEDGTVVGRADAKRGLLEGMAIGARYKFSIIEMVTRDELTGHMGTTLQLVSVSNA